MQGCGENLVGWSDGRLVSLFHVTFFQDFLCFLWVFPYFCM